MTLRGAVRSQAVACRTRSRIYGLGNVIVRSSGAGLLRSQRAAVAEGAHHARYLIGETVGAGVWAVKADTAWKAGCVDGGAAVEGGGAQVRAWAACAGQPCVDGVHVAVVSRDIKGRICVENRG